MHNLQMLFDLFSRAERVQVGWLFLLILLTAFVEVLGVASIMPFMLVVANPDMIQSNRYLHAVYITLDFQSAKRFILFWGTAFLLVVVASNALSAATAWRTLTFTCHQAHVLSRKLLSHYL